MNREALFLVPPVLRSYCRTVEYPNDQWPFARMLMRGEFLDLSNARIYYYAAGTRGAGEPIVFIHGFPSSSHLWNHLVPRAPTGHRLVVLDLLGYGRSDRPVGRGLGLGDHAQRTVELFDALGIDRACIVGHDIGGGIAQLLAIRYPRRVSRLCLVNSVAFDAWSPRVVKMARPLLPLSRVMPASALVAAMRAGLLGGYVDRERGAHSLDLYLRPFASSDGRDVLLAHLKALHNPETAVVADELRTVAVPSAVVWGERDPFLPVSLAQRLHAAIPGSTVHVMSGACHFLPEEAPGGLAEILAALMKR